MTADWPTIDPSVDDGEHTSDLFTGDLFSDELLDMYNPAAREYLNSFRFVGRINTPFLVTNGY
jgi:hypothetical protein